MGKVITTGGDAEHTFDEIFLKDTETQASVSVVANEGNLVVGGQTITDGADGATGPQGPQGDTGPQGVQGDTGPQGPAGNDGADGAQGLQGDTGAQGPQGIQGETGAQGPQGETGPAGADGAPGADGADGTTVWPHANSNVDDGDYTYTGVTFPTLQMLLYDSSNGATDYTYLAKTYNSPSVMEWAMIGGDGVGGQDWYTGLYATGGNWRFYDNNNGFGLMYDDNYHDTYTSRSLVDKEYADNGNFFETSGKIGASRTYEAENSRAFTFYAYNTEDNNWSVRSVLQLGHFNAQLARGVGSNGSFTSHQSINLTGSGMHVYDSTFNKGLEYGADYSANYTDRSIVDKAYVDSVAGGGSGSGILTASVTKNGNQELPASTSWTDVTGFETPTYEETGSFNTTTGEWTCDTTGKYKIHYNATLDQFTGNNRTSGAMRCLIDGSFVKGSDQWGYHRQNTHGYNNYSFSRTVPITAGQVVKLQARNISSSLRQQIMANNFVFEIEKL